MNDLILNPTSTAQWLNLVNESEVATGCQLEEDTESYLVFMLMRHTGHGQLTAQLVGRDFLQGLHLPNHSRQQQLRDVGDHCLLFSGLFPQQAERRRVSVSYFVDMGRSAYREVAEGCHQARSGIEGMFSHLSRDFVSLMDVLQGIRRLGDPSAVLSPVLAFDLWNETGSQQALKALRSECSADSVFYPHHHHQQLH